MKILRNIFYHGIGFALAWGIFAPLYLLTTVFYFTPQYHAMRFRAKRDGTHGTTAYRKQVTAWQARYSAVITWLFQTIMRFDIQVHIEQTNSPSKNGSAHIQPNASHIIISNHISWFDAVCYPSLCANLGLTDVRYVVKQSALKNPIAYPFLTISWEEACFPTVTRTNAQADIQSIREKSLLALQDGASMLTFCEGTRQPSGIIGTPKWKGFVAQVELFPDCNIVSLTQCLDRPVGKTIWLGHTYFLRTLILNVRIHPSLRPDTDHRTWLEQEFASKAELIRAVRN